MGEILQNRHASVAGQRDRVRYVLETWSWSAAGWISGFLGAFVIALFFFVLDLAAGRPLWTPAALGSALFLGKPLAPDAEPQLALVAGYTGIHLLIFAGVGLITATWLSVRPHKRGFAELLVIFGVLFAACELSFVLFASFISPNLFSELGIWSITAANTLAAAAMTFFLGRMARLRVPMDRDG